MILAGCENVLPSPVATATPLTRSSPTSTASTLPKVGTVPPSATACSRPTPSLAPPLVFQNGNLDLNAPYWLGSVQFFLLPCRDIAAVRDRYGLGPATLVITEPQNLNSDPDDIRSRYFRASVPVGSEASFVTRLAAHPEDFQYVEFATVSRGCVSTPTSPPCVLNSSVEPAQGPAGTSFRMRICCFDAGTPVTKTFTLPGGRTIVLPDTAGDDRTVAAGWGGSVDDERGVYMVTVATTSSARDQIGSLVRFRIS